MPQLKDNLKDILDHTHGLGFIEAVKISGKSDETKIQAMSEDRSVVLSGELKENLEELDGHIIGMARMSVLQGYLNFGPFMTDGTTVDITKQKRITGEEQPSQVDFKSDNGHKASYRFMGEEVAKEQIRVPKFKGADWDLTVTPKKKRIREFNQLTNILGPYEATFSPRLNGDTLELVIGKGTTDSGTIPLAEEVESVTEINEDLEWPLKEVIAIMKLGEKEHLEMSISNQGMLQITMKSGIGNYKYLLPARSK